MSRETPNLLLDEDGKPCRSCNSLIDFQRATGRKSVVRPVRAKETLSVPLIPGSRSYKQVSPPKADKLGHDSWILLHTIASKYSETPSDKEREEMARFLTLFSKFYPVEEHGQQMGKYIMKNKIDNANKLSMNNWLNNFHNHINSKLKKESFPTQYWEDRWINGWE